MIIVWLIIIGAAAGFLATRLMRVEADIVTTVVVGMAGALIGGLILRALATVIPTSSSRLPSPSRQRSLMPRSTREAPTTPCST